MSDFVEVHHPTTGQTAKVPRGFLPYSLERGWKVEKSDVIEDDDRTVSDVLNSVGDDPVKARAALAVEQAGKQRTTLIDQLVSIANPEGQE